MVAESGGSISRFIIVWFLSCFGQNSSISSLLFPLLTEPVESPSLSLVILQAAPLTGEPGMTNLL